MLSKMNNSVVLTSPDLSSENEWFIHEGRFYVPVCFLSFSDRIKIKELSSCGTEQMRFIE